MILSIHFLMLDTSYRVQPRRPVEQVILPADGSFEPVAASEILDESTDSSAFVFLAPACNPAASATEHSTSGPLTDRVANDRHGYSELSQYR